MLQGFLGRLELPPLKVKNIQLHASLKYFIVEIISNLGAVTQWCLCCMHIFQNIKQFPKRCVLILHHDSNLKSFWQY